MKKFVAVLKGKGEYTKIVVFAAPNRKTIVDFLQVVFGNDCVVSVGQIASDSTSDLVVPDVKHGLFLDMKLVDLINDLLNGGKSAYSTSRRTLGEGGHSLCVRLPRVIAKAVQTVANENDCSVNKLIIGAILEQLCPRLETLLAAEPETRTSQRLLLDSIARSRTALDARTPAAGQSDPDSPD
jgi:hypothetical protein